ncbi:amino acid ABC transporter permease [Pseudovibrio sp. Tun.PSC04-5.I4]|uniref:amino acid ABC transporter permease n=1 Tax=Pseudovibrio sp. Tun.PSC04-5.I4 TaxID=1798213 RepID=UPI00088953C5|nr:amino acid ABC transporter permease [Pseudovibrio sp. Tun.PSC04-5.I4]SDQ18551.1 amino acid ABC transporter membrane protein 1, PAAT family [Pseudovibrio sp. Tun.PSC04-5.I4]
MNFKRILTSDTASWLQYLFIVGIIGWLAYDGAQSMGYNWQWYRVPQFFYKFTEDGFQWGEIPKGVIATIVLSSLAFLLASALGLLIAVTRLSDLPIGSALSIGFLELIRNTPLLVLLYVFYYVMGPIFGLSRYVAAVLCLGVFHGALISEIFRAGINAVPRGQWEAARSIGLTTLQVYRYIVLPQALRLVLPPLTGEIIHVIKSSAIVSVIAVLELTTIGRNIISDTYMSFEIWFTIALVYLALTLTLSIFVGRLELKISSSTR